MSPDRVVKAPRPAAILNREVAVNPEGDLVSQAPEKKKSVADGEAGNSQTQYADDAVEEQIGGAPTQVSQATKANGKKLSEQCAQVVEVDSRNLEGETLF